MDLMLAVHLLLPLLVGAGVGAMAERNQAIRTGFVAGAVLGVLFAIYGEGSKRLATFAISVLAGGTGAFATKLLLKKR